MFIVYSFSCFCLLSCDFPVSLVFFVSTLAKRLAVETALMKAFVSKGFPYEDKIEDLLIVIISFSFTAHNMFNFLIN